MKKALILLTAFLTIGCSKDEDILPDCACEQFYIPDENGLVGSRFTVLRPCELEENGITLEFDTVGDFEYITNISHLQAPIIQKRHGCD